MKRRTYLKGSLGVAGVSGLVGTGAFSNTQMATDRNAEVSVVRDNQAFIRLEGRSEFIEEQGGRVGIQIGELEFGDGVGVGGDSVYHFSGADGNGLLSMKNEGPSTFKVYAKQSESELPHVSLFNTHTGTTLSESDPLVLETGGSAAPIGVKIDTQGIQEKEDPFRDFDRTLTIVAKSITEE